MSDTSAGHGNGSTIDVLAANGAEHWPALSRANNALIFEHVARTMGGQWQRWPDAWAADAGTATSHLNSVTLWNPLAEASTVELAGRLSRFFDEGDGGSWHLWSAWATPDLCPYGFTLVSRPPLMVRPPGGQSPPIPPDLAIIEADADETLRDWSTVLVDGFPVPEEHGSVRPLVDARVLGGPLRFWVGYADGQPVTCAASCQDGATVGVHFVATLPQARGRGYGALITHTAAAADLDLPSWLVASDVGRRVYEQLGFALVSRYTLWRKDRTDRDRQGSAR